MLRRLILLTSILCLFTTFLTNGSVFAEQETPVKSQHRLSSAQLNKKLREYQKILQIDITRELLEVREEDPIEDDDQSGSFFVYYAGPSFSIDLRTGKLRRFGYAEYFIYQRYKLQKLNPITKEQALAKAKEIVEKLGNTWKDKEIEIRFQEAGEDKSAGIFDITFYEKVGKYRTNRSTSVEVFTPGGRIVGYLDNTFEPTGDIEDMEDEEPEITKEEAVEIARENWLELRREMLPESHHEWFELGKVIYSKLKIEQLPINSIERQEKGLSGEHRLCWIITIERIFKQYPELRGYVSFVIDAKTEEILDYGETK